MGLGLEPDFGLSWVYGFGWGWGWDWGWNYD